MIQSPNAPIVSDDGVVIKRKLLKLVGGTFFVHDKSGAVAMVFHQKGFKLKEDIRGYSDEAKTKELISIQARQVLDFSAAYDVFDSTTGQKIGMWRRRGLKSILRDEWDLCDAHDTPIALLREDSMVMAVIRRFVSNLIPQNYDLVVAERRVVDYRQKFNPFTYNLTVDFSDDPMATIDRRLAIAGGVLLAAIEGKQSG